MARVDTTTILTVLLVVLVLVIAIYMLDPTFFGIMKRSSGSEGFEVMEESGMGSDMAAHGDAGVGMNVNGKAQKKENEQNEHAAQSDGFYSGSSDSGSSDSGSSDSGSSDSGSSGSEGFADLAAYDAGASFGSVSAPAGCYPRDQLTPSELLPKDQGSLWSQQNPMGTGSLKGKNFLSAGALIGVNTVGQSLRNANLQLRSEPPAPQVAVSIFNQSTIEPDINRRALEIA
jgi:hypothetical protein